MATVLKGRTMLHSNVRGLSQSGGSMRMEGERGAFYMSKERTPKKFLILRRSKWNEPPNFLTSDFFAHRS
jgi:hypothetical protein